MKRKVDKLGFIQIKNFPNKTKQTNKKEKTHKVLGECNEKPKNKRNYFKIISNKVFVSKICK